MTRLFELLQGSKKWRIFGFVLLLIVCLGTLLSVLARLTLIKDNVETRPRLAVVGPMQTPAGLALQQGAKLYLEQINRRGGINGRPVELLALEETTDSADKISADKRVVGVMGHLDRGLLEQAAPVYARAKLRLITPLHLANPALESAWSLGLDPREEARFAANYARNIQQQRLMYVIRDSSSEFDSVVDPFLEVYKRFDTPVRQVWTLASEADEARIRDLMTEIKRIDVGAIYIAAHPRLAARLVKAIRGTGNALEIFGPSALASGEFSRALLELSGKDAEVQNHGIVAATPVLFDTANESAQRFQTAYQQAFNRSPDWLATTAYEAAHYALSRLNVDETESGVMSQLRFVDRQAQVPIQMGIYNGDRLISAPVQLLPIAKGASFNYIDALRQGRVLYVNDRFMFKTNVVYVGVTLHEISQVDRQKETAMLDMSIWFRYRGKFDPQNLQLLNAVEPVKFDQPEESKETEDVQYRRYRIKQQFQLNFTAEKRSYGHNIAGIAFRHRQLNRNNLSYVVDVLGMPTGSALLDDLRQRKVVKAGSDWEIENAWVSQDLMRERGDGAPQYVGMTGEQPLFSAITMGVMLKPETVTARDVIAPEYFIYIAIFGLLGVIAAIVLDARELGRYWPLQSWLLRLIFWPCLLLALGNLLIDWAFMHWVPASTRTLVTLYDCLWWVLGARLADMAIRRFLWAPLETRTGRKVPNIIKFIVSLLIFSLAFAGIVAVVFNQTLTSMLATSGVLAMIVGLAVQANIANVFSGIILNIERPFKVGDYVKINNIIGQVKDITWRTTRLESNDGPMVSLANSKVSESFMENYSQLPHGIAAEITIHTPPDTDQKLVHEIITQAVAHSKSIAFKDVPGYEPAVRYRGIVNVEGQWVAAFSVGYRVKILPKKGSAREELWHHVRQQFIEHGIPLVPGTSLIANALDQRAAPPTTTGEPVRDR